MADRFHPAGLHDAATPSWGWGVKLRDPRRGGLTRATALVSATILMASLTLYGVPSAAVKLKAPGTANSPNSDGAIAFADPTGTASETAAPTDAASSTAAPTPAAPATAAPTPDPTAVPTAAPTPGQDPPADPTPRPTPRPTRTPTPPPPPSSGDVVQLGPNASAAQIEAVIKDTSIDTLELLPGTYTPGRQVYVNVDRSRHLLIHPKTPGTVVFKGGGRPAFYIGLGGEAGWSASARGGNVTIDGLIFDGYHMGPDGIIWTGNAHDITLTHITVRNSTGQSDKSWALYVSTSGGRGTTNLVANYWTVDGGNRTLGAMQTYHNPNGHGIVLHHWTVKNAGYAIYAQSDATGLDIADWTISSSGYDGLSVVIRNVSGVIKNVHATNSDGPSIQRPMVDGGGNSWK